MAKPATLDGYSDQCTLDCERVLVTLLRGLGPWKESVYLIGGLTPRYCLEHAPEGLDVVAQIFRQEREGKHGDVVRNALAILHTRFAQTGRTEGYRKDGSVAVAKFELGESDALEQREARALRQREASDVIEQLLARIG